MSHPGDDADEEHLAKAHVPARSHRRTLILVLAGLCILAGGGMATLALDGDSDPSPFDAEGWKAGAPLARGRMVRDLLDSHRLEELDVPAVRSLLGEPDGSHSNGDLWEYQVDLGHRWALSPWSYILTVRFGEGGRVTKAGLMD